MRLAGGCLGQYKLLELLPIVRASCMGGAAIYLVESEDVSLAKARARQMRTQHCKDNTRMLQRSTAKGS